MNALSLGIDTSNYTTSIALVDENENIIYNKGILLEVKPKERGLRQSDALFQQVKNLPLLLKTVPRGKEIKMICYSKSPRPLKDSYMPVFKVGESMALSLAGVLGVKSLGISHQENHIRSAIFGSGSPKLEPFFIAVHFSGGTSEILLVHQKERGYCCKIVAKTLDLNAGQLIDRVGVFMNCDFPAGKAVEALAKKAMGDQIIPSSMADENFHFSGQENLAKELLKKGVTQNEVAYALLKSIAKTLSNSLIALQKTQDFHSVLFSGGVMSNQIIKNILLKELKNEKLQLHFTPGIYARDTAMGNALLGMDALKDGDGDA